MKCFYVRKKKKINKKEEELEMGLWWSNGFDGEAYVRKALT